MSETTPEMKRFFEFLAQHPDAQDKFRSIENQDEAIATAVEVAKENGFNLDAGEMQGWLDAQQGGEGKLSEEELEMVAGGAACWTKTAYSSCPCESGYCASGC